MALGTRAFHLWHLLSLDAPTVAAVWAWAFARTAHIALAPRVLPALVLSTWLLYVLDRLLDGLRPAQTLRERHRFHARHRRAFLLALVPASALLLWMATTQIGPALRRIGFALGTFALLHLAVVHWRPALPRADRRRSGLKEVAVATIFAAACATPSWHGTGSRGWLVAAAAAFALLCWLNCVAIEFWESSRTSGLGATCIALAASTLALGGWPGIAKPLMACIAASAGMLAWLDRRRDRIDPTTLRAAADAVLLTPLLLLPWL